MHMGVSMKYASKLMDARRTGRENGAFSIIERYIIGGRYEKQKKLFKISQKSI